MNLKREDLIAPHDYNIVDEIEKFSEDTERKALIWQDDAGNKKEVTYKELMSNVNKIGNAFLGKGLKKRR